MGSLLDVPNYFRAVYLVDFSPSLCAVAKARFERLGWSNVIVLCQDARTFNLAYHEQLREAGLATKTAGEAFAVEKAAEQGAELVTMSYALSMIPDFYSVIDSISGFLAPNGIIGVCDFYVQSVVDYQSRNYVGGAIDRHCNWLSRVFWRTWFEIDRVNLEPARRVSDFRVQISNFRISELRFPTLVLLGWRAWSKCALDPF